MPRGVKKDTNTFCGTGRRKSSIARVRIMSGKGDITINGKTLDEYLPSEILKSIVKIVMKGTDQSNKIRMALYLNELIKFYLLFVILIQIFKHINVPSFKRVNFN